MLKPLLKAIGAGVPRPWVPDQLFRAGEVGIWYDPSDLSTLFQDAAGTTPVTDVEQPVGLMLDKSGGGHNATQSTAAARPVLRQDVSGAYYLAFDGIDDYMVVNGLTSGVTPITAHFGYVSTVGGTGDFLIDIQTGQIILAANGSVANNIGFFDGAWTQALYDPLSLTVATFDLNSASGRISVNGTTLLDVAGSYTEKAIGGTINLGGNYQNTGARFTGNLYQTILRTATSSDADVNRAEVFINNKMGGGLL